MIGVPSSGKTTVLNFLRGADEITYFSDKFTPRSFMSHYSNKNGEDLEKLDLLKRIIKKCFIVPDLGVIFGKRKDDVQESLSILTRVLDGDGLTSDSGTHGPKNACW